MSYIQTLRKHIGHAPIINVGATVIVLNEKNEILLNLRTDTGTWGIIGGGMELGESLEQTAARELLEEANLTAERFELLDVLSGEELYFKYPNGDETYTVIALYHAVGVTGTLRINDDESHRLQYFSLDGLPELESRADYVIKKLMENDVSCRLSIMKKAEGETVMKYDCGFSKENNRFRYRAGGLLVHDDRILFVKNAIGGYFYILGGGVHLGETSEHCIEREFLEETGIHAKAERLAVVCENFFRGEFGEDCHVLEFYYLMKAEADVIENCKHTSDIGENLVWLPIEQITEYEIKPDFIKKSIREIICGSGILHVVNESDRHTMHHTGTIAFETKRLLCRPFREEDCEDMLKNWIANPNVQTEYGEPVYTMLQEVKTLLQDYIRNYQRPDFYRWAIIEKDSGENIGQIAFCRVYSECRTAEIEYCIGELFWDKGYATEALAGLIDHTFRSTEFQKLEAYHRAENTKSGRVLQKSAMHVTDTVERFFREGATPHGEVCYCIEK